ncbi:MAG: lipase family alpha/beta hydrolase [Candidatus Odinarchaeota archaeon]
MDTTVDEPWTGACKPENQLLDIPYFESVQKEVNTPSSTGNDAYWFFISPEWNLYRYVCYDHEAEDAGNIEHSERFRPILLIHGFKSSHSTWDWMAQQLWNDGFRNIFAMELFSYNADLEELNDQLIHVIDQILYIIPDFKFLTLIGHSMGGMVARYYLKRKRSLRSKVRLCVTLGSPHYGVFHILKPFAKIIRNMAKSIIPSHLNTLSNFSPDGSMVPINETAVKSDLYTSTMVNISGSLPLLGGTDGLFKPKPVNDMINIKVPANHYMVHKIPKSYKIIRDLLLNKARVFKLQLLYVEAPESKKSDENEYFFRIKHKNKRVQRYPVSGYVELGDQTLIPRKPLIMYVGMSTNLENELISIKVFQKGAILDQEIVHQKLEIPLKSKEKLVKYIMFTSPVDQTKFVLALFSYSLKHVH